jgi:hypothetical protein
MGTKVTIPPLGLPSNSSFITSLNNDLDTLGNEFDNVLYRDGSQSWLGDQNANSKRLYNLPLPVLGHEPVRLADIESIIEDISSGLSTQARTYATRSAMASALAFNGTVANLTEPGREGEFVLNTSDLTAQVTEDPMQSTYVAVATDTTGASGAWVRQAPGPFLKPEWFGAVGGLSVDDGPAFQGLSNAVNILGGAVIELQHGATYYIGTQVLTAGNQATPGAYSYGPTVLYPFNFSGCTRGVLLKGNGARIRCLSGAKYGTFNDNGTPKASVAPYFLGGLASPYQAMIRVYNCSGGVRICDVELDGNIGSATIGGEYDDTGRQIAMVGIMIDHNTCSVTVENVYSHHHGLDGIEAIWAGATELTPMYPVILKNSQFINNGRQGFSWVGGRGVWAFDCKFNDTGKNIGALPPSAPGSGLDIEAEASICRDGYFVNCEFSNNTGTGQTHVGDVERITYVNCKFIGTTSHAAWPATAYTKFRDCLFVGSVVNVHGNANASKATKFLNCRFSGSTALSPTGIVSNYGGYLLNFGGGSFNVLLDTCTINTDGNTTVAGAYASGTELVIRNCVYKQDGTTDNYFSARAYGINTIDSAGPNHFFDFSGVNYGRLIINGVEQTRIIPSATNVQGDFTLSTGSIFNHLNANGYSIRQKYITDDAYISNVKDGVGYKPIHYQASTFGWGFGTAEVLTLDATNGLLLSGGLRLWIQNNPITANYYIETSGDNFRIRTDQNFQVQFGVNGGIQAYVASDGFHVTGVGVFSGALSATNLSGTNTGDQTITLTGDVAGSGTGSFAATIAANAVTTTKIANSNVTYAKIQNVTASRLLGNPTGAGAALSEISLGADLTFSGTSIQIGAFTGDITKSCRLFSHYDWQQYSYLC